MDPLALLQAKAMAECARVHHRIQEDGYHAGYITQEYRCTPQVSGGSAQSFTKTSDAVPNQIDEECVQAQYLENATIKDSQVSGSKQKQNQDASKEDKKKWKGKDNNTKATAHQCKDPSNHCNIDGYTYEKCWKLHPELNPKNHKKYAKKKNLLATNSSKQMESSSYVDENIFCAEVQKGVNLSSLHHKEEKEINKLFHIKIQIKKTRVYALFDSGSQANLIAADLVSKLGLEVHDHPSPYPLGWVNKDTEIKVTKWCKIKFVRCKCRFYL